VLCQASCSGVRGVSCRSGVDASDFIVSSGKGRRRRRITASAQAREVLFSSRAQREP
jgi:hypothetical protein